MKTRREWFDILPEPYRMQCYDNCINLDFSDKFDSFEDVLSSSFVFSSSPQGNDYWINLKNNYYEIIKQMKTFTGDRITVFCINSKMQQFLLNYAKLKGVQIYHGERNIDDPKSYFSEWPNLLFSEYGLCGDRSPLTSTNNDFISIETFIEYCDNWLALQKSEIQLNYYHKAIIDKENKVVNISGRIITFDKVEELYNECFE